MIDSPDLGGIAGSVKWKDLFQSLVLLRTIQLFQKEYPALKISGF